MVFILFYQCTKQTAENCIALYCWASSDNIISKFGHTNVKVCRGKHPLLLNRALIIFRVFFMGLSNNTRIKSCFPLSISRN